MALRLYELEKSALPKALGYNRCFQKPPQNADYKTWTASAGTSVVHFALPAKGIC